MPCDRKSVEPQAAGRSDENVLAKLRQMVLPEIERRWPNLTNHIPEPRRCRESDLQIRQNRTEIAR